VSRGLGRIERAILEVIEGEAACQRALRSERFYQPKTRRASQAERIFRKYLEELPEQHAS
jgi:hypothetical protein